MESCKKHYSSLLSEHHVSQVRGFEKATGKIHNPDFWQQLDVEGNYPTKQMPATPHWGKVKGFAMKPYASNGWAIQEDVIDTLAGHFPSHDPDTPTSGYKVIVSQLHSSGALLLSARLLSASANTS